MGADRSGCLCCKVDLRKDEDRFGMVEKRFAGMGDPDLCQSMSSCARRKAEFASSPDKSDSKTLKSRVGACKLLLLDGLPNPTCPKPERPPFLFIGLRGTTGFA